MALPWSHWSPELPYPTNAVESPEDTLKRETETAVELNGIVKAYVERASNDENRYAEPLELETIKTYAAHPDLLRTILSVLTAQLTQGYPYNIKSLDILIHLLHAQLLPHPAFYPPTSELYAPVIALATGTQDDPLGVAGHVKAKADEFLGGIGYEVRLGSAWVGRGNDAWARSAWMGSGAGEPSAWESCDGGFLSTTTVSRGTPPPWHFQQHEANHLKTMARGKKWTPSKWW